MLTIRQEQLGVFDATMLQGFEDRMVTHLTKSYPAQCEKIQDREKGDANLRILIQDGIDKAASYGIKKEGDVEKFLNFMVEISPDFDTRSDMLWAHEILEAERHSGHIKVQLIEIQLNRRRPEPRLNSANRV